MLVWQDDLHVLRSLFCFIFLVFSICAGGGHNIGSLLPKGICESGWCGRNSNCSCSSCTGRLYRDFLLHCKRKSCDTSRTHNTQTSVPWLKTLKLKFCSLLSCQTPGCKFIQLSILQRWKTFGNKGGGKSGQRSFMGNFPEQRKELGQKLCNNIPVQRRELSNSLHYLES